MAGGSAAAQALMILAAVGAVNSLVGAFYRALPARDRRGGRLGAPAQLNRVLQHWQDIDPGRLAANLIARKIAMRLAGAAYGAAYAVDPYAGFGLNNALDQIDHAIHVHEVDG